MNNLSASNLTSVAAPPVWESATASTPTFSYPGGKCRLASTLVSFMPGSGRSYVEPFCGRANVFFRAASTLQFSQCWLNDIRTAPFLNALISHGDTVEVPQQTREEFERQRVAWQINDPTALLLEPYLTYSGAGFLAGYRPSKGSPRQRRYQNTLRRAHQILIQTQATITNLDWKLTIVDLDERDFTYFDPPYLKARVHGYRSDDLDHKEMIQVLKNARFRWLLSEYEHPLYTDAFGKPFWRKEVQLCATNFRHDGGLKRRTECLWRNY